MRLVSDENETTMINNKDQVVINVIDPNIHLHAQLSTIVSSHLIPIPLVLHIMSDSCAYTAAQYPWLSVMWMKSDMCHWYHITLCVFLGKIVEPSFRILNIKTSSSSCWC